MTNIAHAGHDGAAAHGVASAGVMFGHVLNANDFMVVIGTYSRQAVVLHGSTRGRRCRGRE
jgi:hypothetical protein